MSNRKKEKVDDELGSTYKPHEDPLADTSGLISKQIPPGVDRRNFLMRSAVGGAAAVMMGSSVSTQQAIAKALATLPPEPQAAAPALSADLNVVRRARGPC